MRTSIYVDGFNPYYGAVKGTAWKWLDLKGLFARLLQPHHRIRDRTFLTHPVTWPLAVPIAGQTHAKVLKTEEKGSDVNLAVQLLNDACLDAYDCAVVVSNDSDLAEAMRLIRRHHPSKLLGLVFPRHHGHPSVQLVKHASFVKKLGPHLLAASQLPDSIPGTNLRKPGAW